MFRVFHSVPEMWEGHLADIESATSSIYIEQFIIQSVGQGEIGEIILQALIKKAKQGLDVRIIVDFVGSFELFKNQTYNDALVEAGVKIFYYKTLGWSRLFSLSKMVLRDHRKLLLVDKKVAWIGGMVIGETFRQWDDFMIRFDDGITAEHLHQEFTEQYERLQDRIPLLAPLKAIDSQTHLVGNAPGIGNRFCYEEICHNIMLAKRKVVIVTPYFAPPLKLLRIIKRRLAEGLEITLMTPRQTDNRFADIVREAYLPKLLKAGLKLSYYETMNHAKLVVIDDNWLTFGSMNLDVLSLSFNHELNITTVSQELIYQVLQTIGGWQTLSTLVTEGGCEYKNLSSGQKLIGRVGSFIICRVL